jgi:hypothetical protein
MKLNRAGFILKVLYERHKGQVLSIVDLSTDLDLTTDVLLAKIRGQDPPAQWLQYQQIKLSRLGYPVVLCVFEDDIMYIDTARRQRYGVIEVLDKARVIRDARSVH